MPLKLVVGKRPDKTERSFMEALTESLMDESRPLGDTFSSKARKIVSCLNVVELELDEYAVMSSVGGKPVGVGYRDARLKISMEDDGEIKPFVAMDVDGRFAQERVDVGKGDAEGLVSVVEGLDLKVVYAISGSRVVQIVSENGAATFLNKYDSGAAEASGDGKGVKVDGTAVAVADTGKPCDGTSHPCLPARSFLRSLVAVADTGKPCDGKAEGVDSGLAGPPGAVDSDGGKQGLADAKTADGDGGILAVAGDGSGRQPTEGDAAPGNGDGAPVNPAYVEGDGHAVADLAKPAEGFVLEEDDIDRIFYNPDNKRSKARMAELSKWKRRTSATGGMTSVQFEKFLCAPDLDNRSKKSVEARYRMMLYIKGADVPEIDSRDYYTLSEFQMLLDAPYGSMGDHIKRSQARKRGDGRNKKDIHKYLESLGKLPGRLKSQAESPANSGEIAKPTSDKGDKTVTRSGVSVNELMEVTRKQRGAITMYLSTRGISAVGGITRETAEDFIGRMHATDEFRKKAMAGLHNLFGGQTPKTQAVADIPADSGRPVAADTRMERGLYDGPDLVGGISRSRFEQLVGGADRATKLSGLYGLAIGEGRVSKELVASLAIDGDDSLNEEMKRALLKELGLPIKPVEARRILGMYRESRQAELSGGNVAAREIRFDIDALYDTNDLGLIGRWGITPDYVKIIKGRALDGGISGKVPGYLIVEALMSVEAYRTLNDIGISGRHDDINSRVRSARDKYQGKIRESAAGNYGG